VLTSEKPYPCVTPMWQRSFEWWVVASTKETTLIGRTSDVVRLELETDFVA